MHIHRSSTKVCTSWPYLLRLRDIFVGSLGTNTVVFSVLQRLSVLRNSNQTAQLGTANFLHCCRESDATYVSLGLLTNRGLAYEGLYKWNEALKDYDEVLQTCFSFSCEFSPGMCC